jgi:hypothetical protein
MIRAPTRCTALLLSEDIVRERDAECDERSDNGAREAASIERVVPSARSASREGSHNALIRSFKNSGRACSHSFRHAASPPTLCTHCAAEASWQQISHGGRYERQTGAASD